MVGYDSFLENVDRLKQRVQLAAQRSERSLSEIRILPVTKNFPSEVVEYCMKSGFSAVGENRVQETMLKQGSLRDAIRWELIGHLQSNKVKAAVQHFDAIQSVDSSKLLEKLQRACAAEDKQLDLLLQVNAGNDPAKFGLEPELVDATVEFAMKCDHLRLKGFMTIAPLSEDASVARRTFVNLRRLLERINRDFGLSMQELSMGMTDDLEIAIEEGSTCIRVGTALFGLRS